MALASLVFLFVLPFFLGVPYGWVPAAFGALGIWGAVVGLAVVGRGPGERLLQPGSVSATDGYLLVATPRGPSRTVTRAELATGWCEPTKDGVAAVLPLRNGELVLVEQPDEAAARAFLVEAGIEHASQAMRIKLRRIGVLDRAFHAFLLVPLTVFGMPILLSPIVAVSVALASPDPAVWVFGVPFSIPLAFSYALLLWWIGASIFPLAASIGNDGILLEKWFRKTFVPFSRMSSVTVVGGSPYYQVEVALAEDERLRVPTSGREQAEALARQLEAGMRAVRSRDREALIDGLARGGRTVSAWREAVRDVLSEGAYRARHVGTESLLRIAEDPFAPEDVRVGAVLALGTPQDEEAKKRVWAAAEASASPRVRLALQRAVDGVLVDADLDGLATGRGQDSANGS